MAGILWRYIMSNTVKINCIPTTPFVPVDRTPITQERMMDIFKGIRPALTFGGLDMNGVVIDINNERDPLYTMKLNKYKDGSPIPISFSKANVVRDIFGPDNGKEVNSVEFDRNKINEKVITEVSEMIFNAVANSIISENNKEIQLEMMRQQVAATKTVTAVHQQTKANYQEVTNPVQTADQQKSETAKKETKTDEKFDVKKALNSLTEEEYGSSCHTAISNSSVMAADGMIPDNWDIDEKLLVKIHNNLPIFKDLPFEKTKKLFESLGKIWLKAFGLFVLNNKTTTDNYIDPYGKDFDKYVNNPISREAL